MGKLEHVNLFHHGDKKEVYAAFQRDLDRDTWVQLSWRLVLLGCAVGAAVVSGHADWLWLFAIERSISKYVDNSNRNWLMHAIDWQERGGSDN